MGETVTVDIKSRWTGSVLFSAEVSVEIEEKFRIRAALELAVKARAYLADANLTDAYLTGAYLADANLADAYLADANLADANLADANLARANLAGAYLADANLTGAYLARANLTGAYLARANLTGAYLARAYLARANLTDANLADDIKLVGKRPLLQIGPIGSALRVFHAYITTQGLRLRAGCFFGTRDEFVAQLNDTHGNNEHAQEYTAALQLIDEHVRLWTPNVESESEAA